MRKFKIKKGLNIPLSGAPEQRISQAPSVNTVALIGPDTIGLRPTLEIDVGDRVKLGETVFTDRHNPDVKVTAPGAGVVKAINRGERRSIQSVVIDLDGDESVTFEQFNSTKLTTLTRDIVQRNMLASGLWTALRRRPFSKIPQPNTTPQAIFVTAIDSNPHAVDPSVVIEEEPQAFVDGLQVLAKLTDGPVYVCTASDAAFSVSESQQLRHAVFSGPHPAGLVGTHVHILHPVSESTAVWHIGYQDVIAAGQLFTTGHLNVQRIVALGGPLAKKPRLLKSRLGASINDLIDGELIDGKKRLVSGSILSGRRASGATAWLGRYHTQVCALSDGSEREFLTWARPGMHKYSSIRAYVSHIFHRGPYGLTTSQNGSPRAMVSIGSFEKVMPLDILATPLLKSLLVKDADTARSLGCLELDEEDLALCSFVCNGKYEYGPFLRENLTELEANG